MLPCQTKRDSTFLVVVRPVSQDTHLLWCPRTQNAHLRCSTAAPQLYVINNREIIPNMCERRNRDDDIFGSIMAKGHRRSWPCRNSRDDNFHAKVVKSVHGQRWRPRWPRARSNLEGKINPWPAESARAKSPEPDLAPLG